jgi:hypothetical protein
MQAKTTRSSFHRHVCSHEYITAHMHTICPCYCFTLSDTRPLHMKIKCMHNMCYRSYSKRRGHMSAFVHEEESVILYETTFLCQHVGRRQLRLFFFSLVELIRLVTHILHISWIWFLLPTQSVEIVLNSRTVGCQVYNRTVILQG